MLHIYIGKSAAGKDYLYHQFLKKNKNAKPVVSYTTRPMRPGETDGIDYNFVTKKEFAKLIQDNKLLEYRSYKTKFNDTEQIQFYGSPRLNDVDTNDYVVILDPGGVEAVIKEYGAANCHVIYVTVSDETRIKRAKKRSGFDQTEWDRRFVDDNIRFRAEVINNLLTELGNNFEIYENE